MRLLMVYANGYSAHQLADPSGGVSMKWNKCPADCLPAGHEDI